MSRKPTNTKSSTKDKLPPLTFDKTTTIADTASISGVHNLTIGANTVINPRVTITTHTAPVHIGAYCLISELSSIGISTPTHNPDNARHSQPVTIEDHVIIEPGCVIEGCIGEGAVLEAGARVKRGAVVGKYCRVPPRGVVEEGEVLATGIVVMELPLARRVESTTFGVKEVRRVMGVLRGQCEAALMAKSGRLAKLGDA
ncbi:MAG: hypothetical protein M1839_006553 [Geoglossum umbratile]|nr:MAG: hypothetical protein M1839_006553 [Geoglossum umbratile]